VLVYAMVGISVILLTGWAGQVSLGQMGFVGVGAAVGAVATREWGLDLSVALVVSGTAGALVALVVGLPALRVRGLFLAVTTLAFATTAAYFLLNPTYFAWIPQGRIERPALFAVIDLEAPATMYHVILACLALVIAAVTGLRRSRTGRALVALRENERGAQAFGISTVRVKLTGFALSGFCAAFAGCLFVHLTRSFSTSTYTATESFGVFTATVVGGLGGQTGAILGAVFSRGGTWFLPPAWALLPSAAGVLAVLLLLPGGFSGLLFLLRDRWLRSVARRFGIVVPSLVADIALDERTVVTHAEEKVEAVAVEHPDLTPVTDPYGSAADAGLDLVPAKRYRRQGSRTPVKPIPATARTVAEPPAPTPVKPIPANGRHRATANGTAAGPPAPPPPPPPPPIDADLDRPAASGRDQ
jgi:branched-chain amino acid transport system permease protein